jgi:hypothetical protein
MDLNINDEMFSYHRGEVLRNGGNIILQKLFKFIAISVGIVLIFLITFEIGENIFKSYTDRDNIDLGLPKIRNLENDENTSNETEFVINSTQLTEFIIEHEETKKKISEFLNLVDRQTYKGKWHMEQTFDFLSNRSQGEMALRMERLISYTTVVHEKVFAVFRLLDGHYIDKWALVRSVNSPYSNITITNNSITQHFNSFVDYGEIFERVNLIGNTSATCKSSIFLEWNNNFTNLIENFNGSFSSDCGFNNFTFNLTLEREDEDYSKVMLYSIVVTLLAVSQIFNTIWLTYKTTNSQTFANSISMITILQNIVWNAYGCLCHFFLTVNYDVSYKLN